MVALASSVLDHEPECVPLLELRARANIALRRDVEAQTDLRGILRLEPEHGLAYRLLGELAARRDEYETASIFFREALRLDPSDREANDWLAIVEVTSRPAAAAQKLPAPAAAAGRFPSQGVRGSVARARTGSAPGHRSGGAGLEPGAAPCHRSGGAGLEPGAAGPPRTSSSPARIQPPGRHPRFASGTEPPDDECTTAAFPPLFDEDEETVESTTSTSPRAIAATMLPARPTPRPMPRPSVPELPGFGDFLVAEGILTRERLRAAQAYQRSMKVQLATAVVTLGLATEQRIEWAAVAHHSHVARPRA